MTAQRRDSAVYKDKVFTIFDIKGENTFQPHCHGIELSSHRPTSCWRGYNLTYGVLEAHLVLVSMNCFAIKAPPLFNVEPRTENDSYFEYLFLDQPPLIPFTGIILLGTFDISPDLFKKYDGKSPIWTFNEVHVLTFDSGNLIDAKDCEQICQLVQQAGGVSNLEDKTLRDMATWIESGYRGIGGALNY